MIFSFTGYEVDTDRIELRHGGDVVHVEPQVFDVLCYLIQHRDRVVSKMELFDEIWDGAFVGESTLTSRIKSVRRVVGDDGRSQRVIRTVHRRGYQFVADVVELDDHRPARSVDPGLPTSRPSGTVTFLFCEIDGSPHLWEQHPDLMGPASDRFESLVRETVDSHEGVVFRVGAGAVAAAFERATDAVGAARRLRADLDASSWPEPIEVRSRLGVHSGEAIERDGDYVGAAAHRAARVAASAHGGQTLVSDVTVGLLTDIQGLTDLGFCQIDPDTPTMRLWQVDGPVFPALRGAASLSPPTLRTELIGRTDELDQIGEAVGQHRLVSIVGPGGAGKTTLALAAANSQTMSFPDGVVFVELASVTDGVGIVGAVAETVGVDGPAAADRSALASHLGRRSALLVLDNCEHLLDGCVDFVDALLDAGTELVVLTTSREPLGADGEVVVPLGSLEDHGPELFIARATMARAKTEVEVDDTRVVELCRKLDGLPLAIELAAAQLQHLGLDALMARLGSLQDLSWQGRTRGRNRHATLDRTISWSYDLLDDRGRWLLRQFGVFPGGFDLAAAEAVGAFDDAADGVADLAGLVAKSLVTWDPTTGRYRLLETIRAFATSRLLEAGEVDAAEERLRRHVVTKATTLSRLERWLSGDHAVVVRFDMDNARFAFERSMSSGHVVDALEIHIGCSYLFRNTTNCADGRQWAARLGAVEEELTRRDRLWALLIRADVAQGTADHRLAAQTATEASELAESVDDDAARVIARHLVALHDVVRSPDSARTRMEEIVELAGAVDGRLVHLLEAFQAMAELSAGRRAEGTALAERIGHEVVGGGYQVFIANWAAWTSALINRNAERLRYWLDRQGEHLTRVGLPQPWMFLWSAGLLAAIEGGDPTDDLRRAHERADLEGHDITLDLLLALAIIEHMAGRHGEAAGLLGSVATGPLSNLSHYLLVRSLVTELREELGADPFDDAMATGAERDPIGRLAEHGLGTVTAPTI